MKETQSGFMFGCLLQMRYLNKSFKLFDFVGKVLHADISYGIPCLLYFCDLDFVWKPREVTNPFPDLSIFTFDSEDVVSILSRLPNFSENFKISYIFLHAFKVTSSSLSLIFQFFLKIALATVSPIHRFKKIMLLTCKIFLPESLPSGATMINRRWGNNY